MSEANEEKLVQKISNIEKDLTIIKNKVKGIDGEKLCKVIKENLTNCTTICKSIDKDVMSISKNSKAIKKCLKKMSVGENLLVYKPSKTKAVIGIALCLLILVLSGLVFCNFCRNMQILKNKNAIDVQATYQEKKSDKISENELFLIKSEMKTIIGQNSRFELVLMIIYLVMSTVVFSLIFYLVVNDDGDIKFSKLNELHNLRTKNSDFSLIPKDLINYEVVEEKTTGGKSGQEKESKIITKKKNLNAELVKRYMDAIEEI